MAAVGAFERLYVHSPDRLARKYAYQVLLIDEWRRCGVEVVFLNHPPGHSPEEHLLLQVQGMVAEYERAKIMERCRRGKLHAAKRGSISVMSQAPYGSALPRCKSRRNRRILRWPAQNAQISWFCCARRKVAERTG